MELADIYSATWESDKSKPPFSASFEKLRLLMFNIVDLVVTIECSDGNIVIRTLNNLKTHFIMVNCNNITKIVAKKDCVMTKDEDERFYIRHVITINYTLSDGTNFDVVINRDGFMTIRSGINVLLERYGLDKSLTYSLRVRRKMILIDNDKRFDIMSKLRGITFTSPKGEYSKLQLAKSCKNVNLPKKPGDVLVDFRKKELSFNAYGITALYRVEGNCLKCRAKDNATGIVKEIEIPFGMNSYEGPFMDKRFLDNGGISGPASAREGSLPPQGFITTLANLTMSRFTTLKVQKELFCY